MWRSNTRHRGLHNQGLQCRQAAKLRLQYHGQSTHQRVVHVLGVEFGGWASAGRQAGGPLATVPPPPLRQLHLLLSAPWLSLHSCTCWRFGAPVASRGAACPAAAGAKECHVGDHVGTPLNGMAASTPDQIQGWAIDCSRGWTRHGTRHSWPPFQAAMRLFHADPACIARSGRPNTQIGTAAPPLQGPHTPQPLQQLMAAQ